MIRYPELQVIGQRLNYASAKEHASKHNICITHSHIHMDMHRHTMQMHMQMNRHDICTSPCEHADVFWNASMLIGKILALANLAATCENEMTSSLGLFLYNAWKFANVCTGTGNPYMCKSRFAPVLAFSNALNRQYASHHICKCAQPPYLQMCITF